MTNTMWELYWLTRVINIHDISQVFMIVSTISIPCTALFCAMAASDRGTPEGSFTKWFKLWCKILVPIFAGSTLIFAFTPTKEEAAFIVAGGAVVAAAQSDAGQRIASKSVAVLEGSLDTILGKEAVAKAQLDVEKRVVDAVKNQMGIKDESKGSEKASGNGK